MNQPWLLADGFPLGKLKRYAVSEPRDTKGYERCAFNIINVETSLESTHDISLVHKDTEERVALLLTVFKCKITFTEKVRPFKQHDKEWIETRPQTRVRYKIGCSFGDFVKLYVRKCNYDTTTSEIETRKSVRERAEAAGFDVIGDDKAESSDTSSDKGLDRGQQRRFELCKRSLLRVAEKHDATVSVSRFKIVGSLRGSIIKRDSFSTLKQETFSDSKGSALADFLSLIVLLPSMQHVLVENYWAFASRSDQETFRNVAKCFLDAASDRLVHAMTLHIYFGKNLYASDENDETIRFASPITMQQFLNLVGTDDNCWGAECARSVFKKLGEQDQTLVDKQQSMLITRVGQINDKIPPSALRKLTFDKFSEKFSNDVMGAIDDCIRRWRPVPKRWRHRREHYVREMRDHDGSRKWKQLLYLNASQREERRQTCALIKEGIDAAEYEQNCEDNDDDDDAGRNVKLQEFVNDIFFTCCFLDDTQALQQCIAVEENESLSVDIKVALFDTIGQSRVGGKITGHKLCSRNADGESSLGSEQEFYVPNCKELPRIVLVREE